MDMDAWWEVYVWVEANSKFSSYHGKFDIHGRVSGLCHAHVGKATWEIYSLWQWEAVCWGFCIYAPLVVLFSTLHLSRSAVCLLHIGRLMFIGLSCQWGV